MKGGRILRVGLAVLVGSVVGALLAVSVSVGVSSAVYEVRAQAKDEMLPEQVSAAFYDEYLGAVDLPAGHNPLVDQAYRSSEFLSDRFVAEIDALLDGFEHRAYDPFLLAQDVPESVEVGEAIVSGETACVPVETSFEGHGFLLTLKRIDGAWKIDDVGPMPDVIVASFYSRYLAHIDNDGGAMQNPLVDGFYRACPELGDAFVARVDDAIASFDKGSFDPMLLAQDVPVKVETGEVEVLGDAAQVAVEMFWGGNPEPSERVVTLKRIEDRWAIVDISRPDTAS